MALKIYGVARSRTLRTLWMATELGLQYEHIQVAVGAEGSRKPEFLKLNPNGEVPFIDDDGVVLSESMAINLYLARKHGGPLQPASVAEIGQALMWTLWAATGVERHAANCMYHTAMYSPAERNPAVVKESLEALKGPLAVLEAALAKGGGTLIGGRFTVADLNVVCVMFYLRHNPEAIADKPAIRAWYAASLARPAAKQAFALRGSD
jgi:glutathione S-transferase